MTDFSLPRPLDRFKLVPATHLRTNLNLIPERPGVYLWLVRHGQTLLELSSYFETDDRKPVTAGGHAHLYTGSAYDLRFRIGQHIRNPNPENSSPRKSLLALEHMFSAVTRIYGSQYGELKSGGLTSWILDNVIFGFELTDSPITRETSLIHQMVSPFNIAHRRQHRYSKYLMAWRAIAFPSPWMKTVPLQYFDGGGITASQRTRDLVAAVNVK
jgi:hypothetical protein